MQGEKLIFGDFALDPANRALTRDGERVEVSARYLDALILMAREPDMLIGKDRFMDEVWRGIPVTDEALTQCIRALRKALGDEAGNPRFIETVPKHGYRFIASVRVGMTANKNTAPAPPANSPATDATPVPNTRADAIAAILRGTLGAAVAGLVIGIAYGLVGASGAGNGGSALSSVLVLAIACTLSAMAGGGGIAAGVVLVRRFEPDMARWSIAGGMLGGIVIGAFGELLGKDGFQLLTGRAPADIAGASEGALLGIAVGLSVWFAHRYRARGQGAAIGFAALAGGIAGAALIALESTMMAGSLSALGEAFPQAPFRLPELALGGRIAGGAVEGAIFVALTCAGLGTGMKVFRDEPRKTI